MDKLSIENKHPRDEHLQFYEPTHTYTVHGEKGYTSVTTFVHQHFEHFNADLMQNHTFFVQIPIFPFLF